MSEYWQCSSVMYRPSKATERVALKETNIPKSNKIIKYSKNGIYYICVLLLVILTLMQSSELIGSYLHEPTYISTQVISTFLMNKYYIHFKICFYLVLQSRTIYNSIHICVSRCQSGWTASRKV